MPHRAIGKNPYAMAFGMEAVIPLEIRLPTFCTKEFEQGTNEVNIAAHFNWAEEKREVALIKLVAYQRQVVKTFN